MTALGPQGIVCCSAATSTADRHNTKTSMTFLTVEAGRRAHLRTHLTSTSPARRGNNTCPSLLQRCATRNTCREFHESRCASSCSQTGNGHVSRCSVGNNTDHNSRPPSSKSISHNPTPSRHRQGGWRAPRWEIGRAPRKRRGHRQVLLESGSVRFASVAIVPLHYERSRDTSCTCETTRFSSGSDSAVL